MADFPSSPDDVVLVGHSMGGFVISEVANRHPDRVKELVYVAAMLPSKDDSISGLAASFGTKPKDALEEFTKYPSGLSTLVKQPQGPLGFKFNPSGKFDAITKTYVYTDNDKIIPQASQTGMTSHFSTLAVSNIATGHLPQYEEKDKLVDLLAQTLT